MADISQFNPPVDETIPDTVDTSHESSNEEIEEVLPNQEEPEVFDVEDSDDEMQTTVEYSKSQEVGTLKKENMLFIFFMARGMG